MRKFKKQTWILLVCTLLCAVTLTILSWNTIRYYTAEKATVNATVVRMDYFDHSTDEKNDFGYQVFVDYLFRGEEYRDIFYGEVRTNTGLEVGGNFDMEIYADAPETVANNTLPNVWFFVAGFVILIAISVKNVKTDLAEEN